MSFKATYAIMLAVLVLLPIAMGTPEPEHYGGHERPNHNGNNHHNGGYNHGGGSHHGGGGGGHHSGGHGHNGGGGYHG